MCLTRMKCMCYWGHVFLHCLSLAVWWGPQWCALPAVWPLLCQNWLQMCGFGLLLQVCPLCSTFTLVPTVVVVGSPTVLGVQRSTVCLSALPFCRRSSARSAGDTVAGGPDCSSLSLLASVVGVSCCCQCRTAQPACTGRCVLPLPSCPWR